MPPTPIDCETIVYQKVNRNLKLLGFFQLVLLTGILAVAVVHLCVDLKVIVTPSMEGNDNNGSGGKVALNFQSDLVLNLTVHDKVSSTPEPELETAGVTESTGSCTWNLRVGKHYPWMG